MHQISGSFIYTVNTPLGLPQGLRMVYLVCNFCKYCILHSDVTNVSWSNMKLKVKEDVRSMLHKLPTTGYKVYSSQKKILLRKYCFCLH